MKRLAIACLMLVALQATHADTRQEFWSWFESVEGRLDPASPDPIVAEDMGYWLGRISPELSYELSKSGRKRVLTLSADGKEALVPLVDDIVSKAPRVKGWKFVSLRRQQKTLRPVSAGEATLDPENLFFDLYDDGAKFGIVFYLPEFVHERLDDYRLAAMRLMSMSIGERDVAGWIGFVDFDRHGVRDTEFSQPFADFETVFDGLRK